MSTSNPNMNNSQQIVPTKELINDLCSCLQKFVVEFPKFEVWHCSTSCGSKCPQCVVQTSLSSLSAILDVYQCEILHLKNSSQPRLSHQKVEVKFEIKYNSPNKIGQSASDLKEVLSDCFSNICYILVNLSCSGIHFISYLSRKVVVKSLQVNVSKISDILAAVGEMFCQGGHQVEVADLIGRILKSQSMSSGMTGQVLLWITGNIHILDLNINNKTEIYPVLKLWKLSLKQMCKSMVSIKANSESGMSVEVLESLCVAIQTQMENLVISLDGVIAEGSNIIWYELLKSITAIFKLSHTFPISTHKMAVFICQNCSLMFYKLESGCLFKGHSFIGHSRIGMVGEKSSSGTGNCDSDSAVSTSPVLRRFILNLLEAVQFVFSPGRDQNMIAVNCLHFLLCQMSHFNKKLSCFSFVEPVPVAKLLTADWLPAVFADQDDQWLTALLLLLKIWEKGHSSEQQIEEKPMIVSNPSLKEDCKMSSSGDQLIREQTMLSQLLTTVMPHKVFLQFMAAIQFDHLVMADFLSAGETDFLSYFLYYLRHLTTHWPDFLSACQDLDATVNQDLQPETEPDSPVSAISLKRKKLLDKQQRQKQLKSSPGQDCAFIQTDNISSSLVAYSDSEGCSNSSEDSNDSDTQGTEPTIDKVMAGLIRLRYHLERLFDGGLFPYNIGPIIRLIIVCETFYDDVH